MFSDNTHSNLVDLNDSCGFVDCYDSMIIRHSVHKELIINDSYLMHDNHYEIFLLSNDEEEIHDKCK